MDALYCAALGMTRNPDLAQDLVQETFKEAWKSFHRYQPGSNCKGWLFRILFRMRRKYVQSSYRLDCIELSEVGEEHLAVQPDVQRHLERAEILAIVDALPEPYRMVLVLADVENFSYLEIAEMMDVPIGTIMSRLNRARATFRKRFMERSMKSQTA